jgi:5,10-methylenetetrahydrofolate reductase
MRKMADLAAGARFPASLLRAVRRTGGDPEAVRRVGVHWATEQARDLLDNDVQRHPLLHAQQEQRDARDLQARWASATRAEMVI